MFSFFYTFIFINLCFLLSSFNKNIKKSQNEKKTIKNTKVWCAVATKEILFNHIFCISSYLNAIILSILQIDNIRYQLPPTFTFSVIDNL